MHIVAWISMNLCSLLPVRDTLIGMFALLRSMMFVYSSGWRIFITDARKKWMLMWVVCITIQMSSTRVAKSNKNLRKPARWSDWQDGAMINNLRQFVLSKTFLSQKFRKCTVSLSHFSSIIFRLSNTFKLTSLIHLFQACIITMTSWLEWAAISFYIWQFTDLSFSLCSSIRFLVAWLNWLEHHLLMSIRMAPWRVDFLLHVILSTQIWSLGDIHWLVQL